VSNPYLPFKNFKATFISNLGRVYKLMGTPWLNVVSKILEQEIRIETVSKEKYDFEVFKKIELSKINETILKEVEEVKDILGNKDTDEFATYYPASIVIPQRTHFGAKILYNIKEICLHADKVISQVFQSMNFPAPPEDLVKVFRLAFFYFVRRHAIFHYLVERGCRLLSEDRYIEYRTKIYERRKELGQGNIEDALAESYSIVYFNKDLQKISTAFLTSLPFTLNELINRLLTIITKTIFINDARPSGYKEASFFIREFETLAMLENNPAEIKNLLTLSLLLKGGRSLNGVFKGLSWLFYEVTHIESSNFMEKISPPKPPYSIKDFLLFVENFRRDDSLFMVLLLPPDEECKF
jgi:hypothetical protein